MVFVLPVLGGPQMRHTKQAGCCTGQGRGLGGRRRGGGAGAEQGREAGAVEPSDEKADEDEHDSGVVGEEERTLSIVLYPGSAACVTPGFRGTKTRART
jgi:hypothetical protein